MSRRLYLILFFSDIKQDIKPSKAGLASRKRAHGVHEVVAPSRRSNRLQRAEPEHLPLSHDELDTLLGTADRLWEHKISARRTVKSILASDPWSTLEKATPTPDAPAFSSSKSMTSNSVPPPSLDSSRSLNAEVSFFLDRLAKPLGAPTKALVMQMAHPKKMPKFSKYSGVVEWQNAIFLWVNIGQVSVSG